MYNRECCGSEPYRAVSEKSRRGRCMTALMSDRIEAVVVVPAANAPGTVHRISVSVTPGLKETFALNDFWSDWSGHVFLGAAVVGILVGLLVMWLSG